VPQFWRDEVAVSEAAVLDRVTLVGHCRAADANRLAVAQHHDGKLAILDAGVVAVIPDRQTERRAASERDWLPGLEQQNETLCVSSSCDMRAR
jgi:hypothetical protein